MLKFLATRVEHDGEYGEVFFANDTAHAQSVCEKMGWFYDGQIMHSVSGMTIEEADALIEQENAKICL